MRGKRNINEKIKKAIVNDIANTFKSFGDIAKEYGVSPSMIAKVNKGLVKSYSKYYDGSFPIRFSTEERNELIVARRKQGLSIEELVEEFHTTMTVVVNVLRKNNIK